MTQNNKIQRFAFFGMIASGFGIAVLLSLFTAMAIYLVGGLQGFDLAQEIGVSAVTGELSFAARAVGLFFWLMTDLLGLWFCCVAFALFRGFRSGGVFTLSAALHLRKIGWLIFALAPVSLISEALGTLAVTCLSNCGNEIANDVQISVSFDDTDVYALVIGVLIVAVGHIFVEAVRISDENNAFV
ncbi:DUF2975 domain-containing protein [Planktotalea sp.]|uniref:DUF2975 domain-containing protein n=1 Tax=Planktotalea sp. TaxID=2029877 RepID=UPI003D6A9298